MKKNVSVSCPICEKSQVSKNCLKTWTMHNAEVFQYQCTCGQRFHFYLGKNNTWAIPRKKILDLNDL